MKLKSRILSLALAGAFAVSAMTFPVFAEETEGGNLPAELFIANGETTDENTNDAPVINLLTEPKAVDGEFGDRFQTNGGDTIYDHETAVSDFFLERSMSKGADGTLKYEATPNMDALNEGTDYTQIGDWTTYTDAITNTLIGSGKYINAGISVKVPEGAKKLTVAVTSDVENIGKSDLSSMYNVTKGQHTYDLTNADLNAPDEYSGLGDVRTLPNGQQQYCQYVPAAYNSAWPNVGTEAAWETMPKTFTYNFILYWSDAGGNSMGETKLDMLVNSAEPPTEPEAPAATVTIGSYDDLVNAADEVKAAARTINIIADITGNAPVDLVGWGGNESITINGNGHTVNFALYSRTAPKTVEVNNLKINITDINNAFGGAGYYYGLYFTDQCVTENMADKISVKSCTVTLAPTTAESDAEGKCRLSPIAVCSKSADISGNTITARLPSAGAKNYKYGLDCHFAGTAGDTVTIKNNTFSGTNTDVLIETHTSTIGDEKFDISGGNLKSVYISDLNGTITSDYNGFGKDKSEFLKQNNIFSNLARSLKSEIQSKSGYSLVVESGAYVEKYKADGAYFKNDNACDGIWLNDGAWWTEIIYAATLDANAGGESVTGMPEGNTLTPENGYITLPELTRDGYEQNVWNTEADGSGKTYPNGKTAFTGKEPLSLYAVWEKAVQDDAVSGSSGSGTAAIGDAATENDVIKSSLTGVGDVITAAGEGKATVMVSLPTKGRVEEIKLKTAVTAPAGGLDLTVGSGDSMVKWEFTASTTVPQTLNLMATPKLAANNVVTDTSNLSNPEALIGAEAIAFNHSGYGIPSGTTVTAKTALVNGKYFGYSVNAATGKINVSDRITATVTDGKLVINPTHCSGWIFTKTPLTAKTTPVTPGNGGGNYYYGGSSSGASKFVISSSASIGGSINPVGSMTVSHGDDMVYTFTAAKGYEVKAIIVDGKDIGKTLRYTFKDVSEDHTIKAEYQKLGGGNADITDVPKTGVVTLEPLF